MRFIIFDEHARIITEHQSEFEQILPHAGWHEQDPEALCHAMRECMSHAMTKLEFKGWSKDSVKGLGTSSENQKKFRTDFARNHQPARDDCVLVKGLWPGLVQCYRLGRHAYGPHR